MLVLNRRPSTTGSRRLADRDYNPDMLRTRAWIASGVLFASVVAIAGVVPQPGKEPIPELMADSILVCKGEVVTASAPDFYIVSGDLPDTTGIARVRVDRCFKGKPESSEISVQVTNHVSNVSPSFFLTTGDYGLFFLNAAGGDVYRLTNPWYGC